MTIYAILYAITASTCRHTASKVKTQAKEVYKIKACDINSMMHHLHTSGHDHIGDNYMGHNSTGHNHIGNGLRYMGHNYIGHNYMGHDSTGHDHIHNGSHRPIAIDYIDRSTPRQKAVRFTTQAKEVYKIKAGDIDSMMHHLYTSGTLGVSWDVYSTPMSPALILQTTFFRALNLNCLAMSVYSHALYSLGLYS